MHVPSLLAFLLTLLIQARPSGHTWDPGCQEPAQDYAARVARHIDTAAARVYSIEEPTITAGPWAREETLVQLLAIAHHESQGFCRAVDEGKRTGDRGSSVCACGIMVGHGRAEGFTRRELLADLGPCYTVGLHRLQNSWRRCTAMPHGRLRTYASGRCDRGGRESADMIIRAQSWWGRVLAAWKAGEIR